MTTGVVYSQPADTGTGTNVNTQLVYLVNHLKATGNPTRLQDLAILTNIPVDTTPALLEKFRAHDRVVYDPKTDLYSYRVCMPSLLVVTDPYSVSRSVSMTSTYGIRLLCSQKYNGKRGRGAGSPSEH